MPKYRRRRNLTVRSSGRQGLWFRYGRFAASSVSTTPIIYQNSIVTSDMWRRDSTDFTQPKRGKGGPLLTSLFGNFAFIGRHDDSTQPSPDMELLIWEEAEGSPPVSDDNSFYQKLDNEHVLHYSYTVGSPTIITQDFSTNVSGLVSIVRKAFNIKVKTRLSGRVVMFAVRQPNNNGQFTGQDVFGSVSGYITTP